MTGARRLAYDWIARHLRPPPARVLDVGCGNAPLAADLTIRGYDVLALDNDPDRLDTMPGARHRKVRCNLARRQWPIPVGIWDAAVCVWSLQCLLGAEAVAWLELRHLLQTDAQLIVIQRHQPTCHRWMDRPDPLNAYSVEGFAGLAQSTGWRIVTYELCTYSEDDYVAGTPVEEANAWRAVLDMDPTG